MASLFSGICSNIPEYLSRLGSRRFSYYPSITIGSFRAMAVVYAFPTSASGATVLPLHAGGKAFLTASGPSSVIPLYAKGATHMVVLEGGAASASASASIAALLAKGVVLVGFTTAFWLASAAPAGDLTIKSYKPTTSLTPSPPPDPTFSDPDKTTKYSALSPFYHKWGGNMGDFQSEYLGSFPEGVTVVSRGAPDHDIFNAGGTLSPFEFQFGSSSVWARKYYQRSADSLSGARLSAGFTGHAHAQMGTYIPPASVSRNRVFSNFYDRKYSGTDDKNLGRGRPEMVVYIQYVSDHFRSYALRYYGAASLRSWASSRGISEIDLRKKIKSDLTSSSIHEYTEVYEIEYSPKVKPKTKKKMPCCTIPQCKYIARRVNTAVKKLEDLIEDVTEYLKHDFAGYLEPYCAEEGSKHPVTGEPLDWSDPKTKKLVMDNPELFPEAYSGPGVKGLALLVQAGLAREATALGTERAQAFFCKQEEPEFELQTLGSIAGESGYIYSLPKGSIYVIVRIKSYDVEVVKGLKFPPAAAPDLPEEAWFGYVSFVDQFGMFGPKQEISQFPGNWFGKLDDRVCIWINSGVNADVDVWKVKVE